MTMNAELVARGPGWTVSDVVCRAGPHDRPFEERHDAICIAAVTEGTFRYRSKHGAALLAPGALLLGNHRHCFECGHEHSTGDRCLAFHFAPDFFETVVSAVPGARRASFDRAHLPALPALVPLLAVAEAAREERDGEALEEIACRVAGAAVAALAGSARGVREPTPLDQRRIALALHLIERGASGPVTLAHLAREAAMSPFHFLRVFRAMTGLSPHQYVLRTRLHRAALRLRRSSEPVSAIALECGFNDLSTFNRRFRRVLGVSPGVWREGRRA
jgi:AraC-like DNA-binding protein